MFNKIFIKPNKFRIDKQLVLYLPLQNRNIFQHDFLWELHKEYQVEPLNYFLFKEDPEYLKEGVRMLVKKYKPEIIHMQLQRTDVFDAQFINELKKKGILLSQWSGDIKLSEIFIENSRYFDFTFLSSYENVLKLRGQGINAFYLQHSYESKVNFKLNIPKSRDIVFIGNRHPGVDIEDVRYNLLKSIENKNLEVYGEGYTDSFSKGKVHIQSDEVNEIYNSAKVALNINHFADHQIYQSDRVYMSMASGTFTLSHYHPKLELILGEDGKYTRYFRDSKELNQLVEYYLNHEREREEIASRGHKFAHQFNSQGNRVEELVRFWRRNIIKKQKWRVESGELRRNEKLIMKNEELKNKHSGLSTEVRGKLIKALKDSRSIIDLTCSKGEIEKLVNKDLDLKIKYTIVDPEYEVESDSYYLFNEVIYRTIFPGGIFDIVLMDSEGLSKLELELVLKEIERLSPNKIIDISKL